MEAERQDGANSARSDFTGGALRPSAGDHTRTADGPTMGDTSLSVPETSLYIRELKQELARRGIDCGSCVEKRELVQLLHDASAPASKRAGASSGTGSSSSGEQPDITKVGLGFGPGLWLGLGLGLELGLGLRLGLGL